MSEEPKIAATRSLPLEVEPGTYWWCTCGRAAQQPFCDGSHKGSGFQPLKFEVAEKSTVHWCQCKHSANAPKCDGTHKRLQQG